MITNVRSIYNLLAVVYEPITRARASLSIRAGPVCRNQKSWYVCLLIHIKNQFRDYKTTGPALANTTDQDYGSAIPGSLLTGLSYFHVIALTWPVRLTAEPTLVLILKGHSPVLQCAGSSSAHDCKIIIFERFRCSLTKII